MNTVAIIEFMEIEASLKYVLIQALASSTLLFIIISKSILENVFTLDISPINLIT